MRKKIILFISSFLIATASSYAVLDYLSNNEPQEFKINRAQTIVTTRKHVVSSIFDAAKIYLWGAYAPTWQRGITPSRAEKKKQHKIFRYNLSIEHIIDNDPEMIINHKRPTLFLHGWGDTKHSAKLLKAFCDVLPGDIVTFQFRDHGILIPKVRHANLGQLPDVLSALYTLAWMKDNINPEAIDIFGYSRGGATAVNLIAVLNDKNNTYDEDLAAIGIDNQNRMTILKLIEKGCITLNCPLTDMNVSVQSMFKNTGLHMLNLLKGMSKYDPEGLQALNSAQNLQGLHLTSLIHFQHHDTIVSNHNEALFFNRIAAHNPTNTYLVLGDDGGHLHTHMALCSTIHRFRKIHGGSYDPVYDKYYDAIARESHYKNKLLRPGTKTELCIASFHNECSKLNNTKKYTATKTV